MPNNWFFFPFHRLIVLTKRTVIHSQLMNVEKTVEPGLRGKILDQTGKRRSARVRAIRPDSQKVLVAIWEILVILLLTGFN